MEQGTGILVFGFSRPKPLEALLISLRRQSALHQTQIWLDGHHYRRDEQKKAAACRELVTRFPEAKVVLHEGHLGIEKLTIDGLSAMAKMFEQIIVLEDDCFPTRSAVQEFQAGLSDIEHRDDVYSVYGHPFLTPSEGETITRFQGWGWATTRRKLLPVLEQLKVCFMMSEKEYLKWTASRLTVEVRARLDVTPGRDVIRVLERFFSWDSCTALITASTGLMHKKTSNRAIFNCGLGPDSGHFFEDERFRHPPFNMIAVDEVWHWYDTNPANATREEDVRCLRGQESPS